MTTLIIKRKFTNAIENPEQLASVIKQGSQNVQTEIASISSATVGLTVTQGLKIPVGTGKYGTTTTDLFYSYDLDDLTDGTTYSKLKATQVSAGQIYLTDQSVFLTGYNPSEKRRVFIAQPTTPYDVGDLWLSDSVVERCTTARSTGAFVAEDWSIQTLDSIADGTVYNKVLTTDISAGHILLSSTVQTVNYRTMSDTEKGIWNGKPDDMDDIPAGATYSKILTTDIDAGHILLSSVVQSSSYRTATDTEKGTWNGKPDDLDELGEGTTYKRVLATEISSGRISLTATNYYSGKFSGEWYSMGGASGVDIDATTGINIYGTNNALTTRATKSGTIQCSVNASGQITAGAGSVLLGATGITLNGDQLLFYDGVTWGGSIFYNTTLNKIVIRTVDGTDDISLESVGDILITPYTTKSTKITRMASTPTVVTGSRAIHGIYQNTGTAPLFVTVSIYCENGEGFIVYVESGDTTPDVPVASAYADTAGDSTIPVSFIVPVNYYYEIHGVGTPDLQIWTEWGLGL